MKSWQEYNAMNHNEKEVYLKGLVLEVESIVQFKNLTKIVRENVKHYIADYYQHDIQAFLSEKSGKYLWIVRDCGTNLVPLESEFTEYQDAEKHWWDAYKVAYGKREKLFLVTAGPTFKAKQIEFSDVKDDWFKTRNGSLADFLKEQGSDDVAANADKVKHFVYEQMSKNEILLEIGKGEEVKEVKEVIGDQGQIALAI